MKGPSPRGILAHVVVLAVLICACGSSPERRRDDTKPDMVPMPELRALELIDGWLTEAGWIGRAGWVVELADKQALDVDLRLGVTQFGIEWVSAADRTRYGKALPAPAPDGQLRLYRAPGGAQILVLDHEMYRSPKERTLDRTMVLNDAELKLRRDLMDYLAYVGSQ